MSSSAWQISASEPKDWRSIDCLSNLRLNTSVPIPSSTDLAPKTALVRMRAAAINARDVMVIAHDPIYPPAINNPPDLVPCCDGAGEIIATGPSSVWKKGDRVLIHPMSWIYEEEVPSVVGMDGKGAGDIDGTLRQFAVFEDTHLLPAPSHLSFEELASLPSCGGTMINAFFFGPQPLKAGMTILTQGTGGVSCFAIQIAALSGCTVISTSSSDSKLSIAKTLGATHTINYKTTPEWGEEVLRITEGRGVDHVVDVGGGGTIAQSLKATKQGGCVSVVGFLGSGPVVDLVGPLLFGGKTVRGVLGFNRLHEEKLVQFVSETKMKPAVGGVFKWEEAREAFKRSMEWEAVGKIVIKI